MSREHQQSQRTIPAGSVNSSLEAQVDLPRHLAGSIFVLGALLNNNDQHVFLKNCLVESVKVLIRINSLSKLFSGNIRRFQLCPGGGLF